MAFLSLLDDRAMPKGSRDPLGFEVVWSHFGRKVIGNLTTITSSMDNFTVAILGFYWANELVPVSVKEDRSKIVREWFLRYEQLTGYVRHYGGATDVMGITRIKNRIRDGSKVFLGMDVEEQILSNQASYGLWGLYSSAARDTGLIKGEDRLPTDIGKGIALAIIRELGDSSDKLFKLMQSEGSIDNKELEKIAASFIRAIHHESVRTLLLDTLMSGNECKELQKELWQITNLIFADSKIKNPDGLADFVDEILKQNPSPELSKALVDIKQIERLLVAINEVFHYCRRKDGVILNDLLQEIQNRQYQFLPETLPMDSFSHHKILASILAAFHANDFERAIGEILKLNKIVMDSRGAPPWVELESEKILRVKVKSEIASLKSLDQLETDWDYDYFLGSFLQIARKQLGET